LYTPLTLKNGWTSSGVGWGKPAVRVISGIVHLEGAMRTAGTNAVAFTLPAGDRPTHVVYITVVLGGDGVPHTNGRLYITPSGTVTVQAETGHWISAQSFTSLDGASFAR